MGVLILFKSISQKLCMFAHRLYLAARKAGKYSLNFGKPSTCQILLLLKKGRVGTQILEYK